MGGEKREEQDGSESVIPWTESLEKLLHSEMEEIISSSQLEAWQETNPTCLSLTSLLPRL